MASFPVPYARSWYASPVGVIHSEDGDADPLLKWFSEEEDLRTEGAVTFTRGRVALTEGAATFTKGRAALTEGEDHPCWGEGA